MKRTLINFGVLTLFLVSFTSSKANDFPPLPLAIEANYAYPDEIVDALAADTKFIRLLEIGESMAVGFKSLSHEAKTEFKTLANEKKAQDLAAFFKKQVFTPTTSLKRKGKFFNIWQVNTN